MAWSESGSNPENGTDGLHYYRPAIRDAFGAWLRRC